MDKMTIGGIEISVEKKKIKHMYIRVLPPDGRVSITAPRFVSDETLRSFVESRITWIQTQQEKVQNRIEYSEPKYISGEKISLWGQSYSLEIVHDHGKSKVCLIDNKVVLQVREDSTAEQRGKVVNEWYRQLLKAAIPTVMKQCEETVGVTAHEWNVKQMRTRWGTCNVRARRIWLNLQLVTRPPECLEYVVTHELVHLLEASHNHVFKGYMDQFYPDWKRVKQQLNHPNVDGIGQKE